MKKILLLAACCAAVFSASAQHLSAGFMPLEYEKGAFELQPADTSVLDKVMEILGWEPSRIVLIEGHADAGEGTKEEKDALSLKRAQAIAQQI
jgi:outer membrane protein OmpA-like peptidoglycan-associated protein